MKERWGMKLTSESGNDILTCGRKEEKQDINYLYTKTLNNLI